MKTTQINFHENNFLFKTGSALVFCGSVKALYYQPVYSIVGYHLADEIDCLPVAREIGPGVWEVRYEATAVREMFKEVYQEMVDNNCNCCTLLSTTSAFTRWWWWSTLATTTWSRWTWPSCRVVFQYGSPENEGGGCNYQDLDAEYYCKLWCISFVHI